VRFTTFWHHHRIMTHFWPPAVFTNTDWRPGNHHWKSFCQRFMNCCLEAKPTAKNFQWWSMTLVTICFVTSQNQKTKKKNKNHLCYFTLTSYDETIMTPHCRLLPLSNSGRQCIFVTATWGDLDQSCAGILHWGITITNVSTLLHHKALTF